MPKYLRAYRADEVPESGPIPFVASTEGVKRDGLELKAENWDLANYQRNPVFLWAHDYMGQRLPLGRADVEVRDGALHASVTFDNEDEFARQVEGKYRRGFLNAVSVGWNEVKEGLELLDISAVPVPGDPDALIQRQARALRDLAEALEGVMQPGSGDLEAGKEDDMPDGQRIGAVLNARNKERLQQAVDLIREVLKTADKAETPEEDDERAESETLTRILDQLKTIGG